MAPLIIATFLCAALVGMSMIANRTLHDRSNLPMQWALDGKPTWTAPRWLALSLTPALGAVIMAGVVAAGGGHAASRTGIIGAGLVATHALHLFLLQRSRDRR